MSLPNATKDISDHPGKNAVTDPLNKEAKAADVDRKMRFYGVIEAFRQGKYPSNQQIDQTLKHVLSSRPVDEAKLSPDGRKLIQDTRDIIETARLIVQEKNADELFQNFLWHTGGVDLSQAKKDPNEVAPVDKGKLQDDRDQAVHHLRTLFTLIATNSEVRKLLSDFSVIGRDVLARGAAHAAENIRPDQDALAQVDRPAPSDQFHTAGGRTGTEVQNGDEVRSGEDAANQARNAAYEAKDRTKDVAQNEANQTADQVGDDNVDPEMKKQGLKSRLQGFKNGLSDRVPQEHKDTARGKMDQGRKVLLEDYFPEDRRDQFIYRGKKVILECQKHDDYQGSIRWLLGAIEEYAGHGKTVAGHGKDSHGQLTSDSSLQQSTTEIRTLLERFANGQSMDIIFDAINNLINDARNDDEFRQWFQSVDAYSRKVLLEPGYVLEPQCNSEGRQIRDSGRRFYDEKYKGHFDRLFDAVGTWFNAMGEDPLNKRFGDDWARLTRDLLFDNEGSLKFKPELWMDIRKVIVPTLVDEVGYVPIPRVEYTDDALDLVVENLTLQGRNLFPNVVSIEAHNFMKFSPYNTIKDENHHEFTLTLGHIQADMKDVAFYFKKKTGIPKLSDSGLADVFLGGQGLTATVHMVSADKDRSSVFKVKNVNVKVDSLKFSIRDSKHDILYKTLKPLATGLIKRQIQKAVADAIKTGMEYVDGQLVAVRDRMDEAKKSDEASRTEVLKSLFQKKKDEAAGSVKSTDSKRNSQFKIVAQRDSSIIPDAGHPSGWSGKAQERVDMARGGKEWRSDAYVLFFSDVETCTDTPARFSFSVV
ncbi:hypothetical protein FA95DRAFT_1498062 [Auriscalpium vulgare]|uniref:Uncharacterized protein n=1 Tax=Auriscalpium vulgare TaxID=40419 RepID=A0ACB8RHX4_9AGAM|nr:hypothetical protein FA95DRAFT_1498062 [Auriscalpium vulgare]